MAAGWRGQYYKYREFSLTLLAIYKQRSDLQAFLEIILSLTTLIIFIVFAIKPTVITIIGLTQEIKAKEETLNILNQKIGDLQSARTVFIQNQSTISNIEMSIFTVPEPDRITKQVIGLASKNSVKISGINIEKSLIVGQIESNTKKDSDEDSVSPLPDNSFGMPLSINLEGTYLNLVAFLKDVENLRIPVKIDNINLNLSETDSGTVLTELINGRVPYLGKKE